MLYLTYHAALSKGSREVFGESAKRRVLRWDPYLEPNENDMEFRLTWAGNLIAHPSDRRKLPERSLKVHGIRKAFHPQLAKLRNTHPAMKKEHGNFFVVASEHGQEVFDREGFQWLPIVTRANGLICKLEILLLRNANPGDVLADIDNRLKTIFDALRMPSGPDELGAGTSKGKQVPDETETPFCVLLEDDSLITHVAVTTDRLLEEIPGSPEDTAARLLINVTIRPYDTHTENVHFT